MADTHNPAKVTSEQPSSQPVEMGSLPGPPSNDVVHEVDQTQTSSQDSHAKDGAEGELPTSEASGLNPHTHVETAVDPDDEAVDGPPGPLPLSLDTSAPTLARKNSEAIGPDLPTPMLQTLSQTGPHLQFILLLASAGTRHPFQLNERYLAKRNVGAMGPDGLFDPSVISVYNLKELIFKDWRDDWEMKPSSPSAIRLIYFGQLLADNTSLKECKINTDGSAHVLHISVKPQEVMDDDDAGKAGKSSISRDRDGSSSGGGCRCVIL